MSDQDLIPRVLAALDVAREYLNTHGGDIRYSGLVGYELEIEFLDACKGCPFTEVTLRLHIERVLRERVPEITKVKIRNG